MLPEHTRDVRSSFGSSISPERFVRDHRKKHPVRKGQVSDKGKLVCAFDLLKGSQGGAGCDVMP